MSAPAAIAHPKAISLRFDTECIDSIEVMDRIIADPANGGKTYQVTQDVFTHFSERLRILPSPPDDIPRINRMLGTDFPADSRMGLTNECICPSCGHGFSFADHIESVVRMGLHTATDLKRLLTGNRYFLTVATDRGREMLCPKCDTKSLFPRVCYATTLYAYAGGGDHST